MQTEIKKIMQNRKWNKLHNETEKQKIIGTSEQDKKQREN